MSAMDTARGRRQLREEFGTPEPRSIAYRKHEDARGSRRAQVYTQVVEKTGVKTGDVVRNSGHGICVVTGSSLQYLYLRLLPSGCRRKRSFCTLAEDTIGVEIMFRPPETHSHPFTVYPVRSDEEGGEEYYLRAKRLQAFIAARIGQEDCLQHELYGTFWVKTVIARLTKEFAECEI